MAEIVLIHGIDQQRKSADLLKSNWLPALAGGVRKVLQQLRYHQGQQGPAGYTGAELSQVA